MSEFAARRTHLLEAIGDGVGPAVVIAEGVETEAEVEILLGDLVAERAAHAVARDGAAGRP